MRLAGNGLLAAGFLDAAVCVTIRIGLLRHVQEGSGGEEAGKGGEARHDFLQVASGKVGPDCLEAIFPDVYDKKKLMLLMVSIEVVDGAEYF